MARIHPSQPDAESPSSEKKVFERLRDDLPSTWTVLHSKRFLIPARDRGPAQEGEIDFLVLDPDRGMLGIEVKGGGIGRDADGWYSDGRSGRHRIKDPGAQAQIAMHAIWRYLREAPLFKAGVAKLSFGICVVFPDTLVTQPLGPELPLDLVIDQAGLRDLRRRMDAVFQAQRIVGPALQRSAQLAIVSMLAPTLHLVPALASRLDDDERILVRLTNEQMNILDTLSELPRVAVKGSAGTGKTLVAMERARRLAADGKRVLFLCYNRPLADFLAPRAEGFTVTNFHSLCRDKARSAGLTFQPPDGAGAQSFWDQSAPQLLMDALKIYPDERWDAVVVDEGQDFKEYWWLAVEHLLRGSTSSLWVFFDPNQDIFGGGPTAVLNLQPTSLTWNCRNTERIASYASALLGQQAKLRPEAPRGEDVELIRCADDQAMKEAVRKALHRLVVDEKLDPNRVVVLSPRSAKSSLIWKAKRLGNLTLVEHPGPAGRNEVIFASLQQFKGLEADAIVLCEVERGQIASSPAHLYVGSSRARHLLVVAEYDR